MIEGIWIAWVPILNSCPPDSCWARKSKAGLQAMSSPTPGICKMPCVSGGATNKHNHGFLPLLCVAWENDFYLQRMAENHFACSWGFVFCWMFIICLHLHRNLVNMPPSCSLSPMACYGHSNMKPTVVFGSAFGSQTLYNNSIFISGVFFPLSWSNLGSSLFQDLGAFSLRKSRRRVWRSALRSRHLLCASI